MVYTDIKYYNLRVMHLFFVLIYLIAQCTFMDHLKLLFLCVFVCTYTPCLNISV